MPAMSPTMTEGNISSWKVKEGDTFSTGDVLLEIETDKATMDVEAQDDGIMAKIFAQDGSKGVQVGTRIAVLADEGDDISSLEIPSDDSKPISKQAENVKRAEEESPPKEASSSSYGSGGSSGDDAPKGTPANPRASRKAPASSPSGPGQNTKYPLYPSVIALVHEHHLSDSDVSKIPATGPQNRLLKGDVLAYLGSIAAEYSSQQSQRIEHMSHLDLSNIKVMATPEKPATPKTEQSPIPEPLAATNISLPISLHEVLKVQKRIQDSLGVSMPLATFLARAVDIANDDLPVPKGAQPTPDELFNAVLGLNNTSSMSTGTSRGLYVPEISALPLPVSATKGIARPRTMGKQPDILDILSGRATSSTGSTKAYSSRTVTGSDAALSGGATNIFSITVPAGEERRARVFLERMKTVLQAEPGRLVL